MDKKKKLEYLLHDLCVELGFCIPPKDAERIINIDELEADQFAYEILILEGMNPKLEKRWRKEIQNRFIKVFDDDN